MLQLLEINFYKLFYWMTVADNVNTFLLTISIIALAITISCTIGIFVCTTAINDSRDIEGWTVWLKAWRRPFYPAFIVTILFGTAVVFTPTKKDCFVIVAGGAIGNFVSSDSSSRAIPAELTKYVHSYLKKEAADMDIQTKEGLGIATPKESFVQKIGSMTKEQIIEYIKTDTTLVK